jgi:uroporphyrinogen decarboxylase
VNARQRVLSALSCHQPDRVPVVDYVDVPVLQQTAHILGLKAPGLETEEVQLREVVELTVRVIEALDLDAIFTGVSIGEALITSGRSQDKFGCIYRVSEHGESFVIQGPVKERADLRGFDMASQLEPGDFAQASALVDKAGRGRAHFLATQDPFRTSWTLRGGMEHLLLDYVLHPELVHDLARVATDYNMALAEMAIELDLGVDALFMGGDLADERTTLMSPRHYREFIKPYHKEIADHAHRLGLEIVKHTDGNLWPILDDFVEVGFDAFHPVQPQCMDIGEVKEHLAGKMCIIGNIDCRDLLPFGTSSAVIEAVKETIARAAPGGGYILSSSNSIHPGVRAENLIAMVEAARAYGVYDL